MNDAQIERIAEEHKQSMIRTLKAAEERIRRQKELGVSMIMFRLPDGNVRPSEPYAEGVFYPFPVTMYDKTGNLCAEWGVEKLSESHFCGQETIYVNIYHGNRCAAILGIDLKKVEGGKEFRLQIVTHQEGVEAYPRSISDDGKPTRPDVVVRIPREASK